MIKWRNVGGSHGENPERGCWAHRVYRDDALGVQKEVHTLHTQDWTETKRKEFYFRDGVRKRFKSEKQLLAELEPGATATSSVGDTMGGEE